MCVWSSHLLVYSAVKETFFLIRTLRMRGIKIEMPNKTSQSKGRVPMCKVIALSEEIEMLLSRNRSYMKAQS